MEVTINTATLASVLGLCSVIIGILVWVFNVRARFLALEKHDKKTHELTTLLVKGQVATLEGLKQLGCNGAVTKAYEKLKEHVIEN